MIDKEPSTNATVDDVIKILQEQSNKGRGGYVVTCNSEYILCRKQDIPSIHDRSKTIDLGGYCGGE